MNFINRLLRSLAMTYCHYITMRLHFRSIVIAQREKSMQKLLNTADESQKCCC